MAACGDSPPPPRLAHSRPLPPACLAHLSRSEDIEELFGEIGALKSVSLLTKEDGSSRGMALVVFKRKADAEAALEKYNGVPLDGRPLKISLQSNLTPVSATTPRGGKGAGADAVQIISGRGGGRVVTVEGGGKGGGKGKGVGRGRGRGGFDLASMMGADEDAAPTGWKGTGKGKGRGKGGKGKGGKGKGAPVSADDLDADLESYHNMAAS